MRKPPAVEPFVVELSGAEPAELFLRIQGAGASPVKPRRKSWGWNSRAVSVESERMNSIPLISTLPSAGIPAQRFTAPSPDSPRQNRFGGITLTKSPPSTIFRVSPKVKA